MMTRTPTPTGLSFSHHGLVHIVGFASLAFVLFPLVRAAAADENRPNIVMIMTDNHGAWTLGCYGNQDIRTPHIDRLAREGTLFTQAFASNPVCSPTRATFLTGLLPSQHGVHCFLFGGRLQVGPEARCTLDNFTSLPEVLRDAGYACGLVGKWHLGDNLHPQEGFDDYWITMPHGGTSTFYDAQIIEGGKIRTEPQYLTDFWTDHAVKFIDNQAEGDKPFFLFLSYNGPYSLSRLLLREGRNRHAEYYRDKVLPSFPRQPAHPWQLNNLDFHNNPVSIRRVATEVSGVDDGVGTVMQTLKRHGMDDNTIVVFVADQGWAGGHGGFFGMGDHTRPLTARDGMMQIPMIWRQPGRIAAGIKSERMVTNYDFMPTLLSHLGLGEKMPQKPKSPGADFSKELYGKAGDFKEDAQPVFYEFENLRCIRTQRWKYVHRHPNGPHELYDLNNDPDEFNNLVSHPAHGKTRDQLKDKLNNFYAKYAQPEYDLWKGGGSQTKTFVGIDEELAQADPVEPPAFSKGFTLAPIEVPQGFSVELAAGPPLVTHPTLACFDDRGRLFVCNNAGVNMSAKELEENVPNSIRLLEDRDGDGRFDRSTVFADKMTYPMGGAWHDGALYVASPPNIWRLQDTDGDGVADKRDVLVSQFGYTGNAASIHGCFFGPDGRLYWCDGYHGHEFKDEDGNVTSQREGSYIFSCRTDGSDVRIHCGGGMDNPVEVDFTEQGEMLGTVNIFYTRPRVDCLVHWLHGGAYPHREKVLQELKITGPLLGPVHRFGHVAISGTARYRSGVFDHRWRDNQFATFFNIGKVVRLELQREGATFGVTQREFLSSTSRDFHPTDVVEDADGSLLVVDTGGWFYRGCPTSQHAKPDVLGAIYRVRRDGMTTQVDPWGQRIDWPKRENRELVGLLNDTRYKVRERAIAECAKRGEAIVPSLKQTVQRRDIRARLAAVWALTRIAGGSGSQPVGGKEARAALRLALDDRHPDVRLAACRSLATYPDSAAKERLAQLLKTDESPIRREAATALGRLGDASAVPALLSALGQDTDRTQEHAVVYALIEIDDPAATRAGLNSKSADTRRGALLALDQMDKGDLTADDLASIATDNIALQQTTAEIFSRHPDWSNRAAEVLGRLLAPSDSVEQNAAAIRRLTTKFLADPAVGKLVGSVFADSKTPIATRDLLLAAIADGRDVPLHKSWIKPLERLLKTEDRRVLDSTLAALAAIKTDQFRDRLRQLGGDVAQPPLLRVAALEVASGRRGSLTDESLIVLLELLGSGTKESLQAAQKIGSSALGKPQLVRLAPLLVQASPSQLHELVRSFQRSSDPDVARAFLSSMEKARSLTSLAEHEFSDVIKRYPKELLPTANALLVRIRQEEQQKLARLDKLLPLLKQGDAARGRELFFAEKSKCAACHRVADKGGRIGPDLTTIGANRSPHDLLESIVLPSATIVRDYEPYNIATTDGRVLTGLIARETADTVFIQQQTGEPVAVPRDDIEELTPGAVSIMPNGLEKALSESDLADVIAYLQSLKQPPNNRAAAAGSE